MIELNIHSEPDIRLKRNPILSLRRLNVSRTENEICELCSVPLAPSHRHLLKLETRMLVCTCDACAIRFQNVIGGKFALVPRDVRFLSSVCLTDARWESLGIPIDLAFFIMDSQRGQTIARYPSPAGSTEAHLSQEVWDAIVRDNPDLSAMNSDVEALLVNRIGTNRKYYLAPIDACFQLVGLIRKHWRGFSGGEHVWLQIENFFTTLDSGERNA